MRRWRSEGRVLFWKVRVSAQRCRNSPPAKSSWPCSVFFSVFFFLEGGLMYSATTRPLLFFLSWTHLSLPLALCVIYVHRQLLDVRKLFPDVSPGSMSLLHVWRRRQRPAPPAAEQMFGCSSTSLKLQRSPGTTAAEDSFPAADRL